MLVDHEVGSDAGFGEELPDVVEGPVLEDFDVFDVFFLDSLLEALDELSAEFVFDGSHHFLFFMGNLAKFWGFGVFCESLRIGACFLGSPSGIA